MNNFYQIDKNEILDDIFDNTFVAIILVDKKRIIKVLNDAFCKLFGYKKEEIIGESVLKLHINNNNFINFRDIAFNKITKNQPVSLEYEFLRKDGTTFWGKISGNPTKDKNYFLWMIVDISETIEIKNRLKEQTNLLKTVIDENPNPIILKNYDAKFVLVNKATSILYNSSPEEMIGKDDGDFIPDQKLAKFFKENVQAIMKSGKTEIVYEDSIDVKTNEVKNYMSIKKPFKNQLQEDFILVIANDVTELNKKNEELVQKEKLLFQQAKLASMGEMIGNIAHQWRQPLSSISVLASGIKLQKELDILKDEDFIYSMDKIINTTQYLSQTIEDFRSFFDSKNSKITTFNIEESIEKTISLIDSQLKYKEIKIIKKIDNFKITTLENELIQVLVNILNNSKDALLEKEKEKFIQITSYKDLKLGYIEIIDNAGGIDSNIIDKIFEPYFTTKHKSLGSGIGLYMSEEIVKKHLKGKIFVENHSIEINKNTFIGAKFTIILPLKL
jgi:two-component system, sporulation sensor kinase A